MLNTLNPDTDLSDLTEWLLQRIDEAIYIIEPQSLKVRLVSNKVLQHAQQRTEEVIGCKFDTLLDATNKLLLHEFLMANAIPCDLAEQPANLKAASKLTAMPAKLPSNTGDYRYDLVKIKDAAMLLALHLSSQPSITEPNEDELHYQTIVSNLPVLVYQLCQDRDNQIFFSYLSESCENLLDMQAEALQANMGLFLERIVPEDRHIFMETLRVSASELKPFNWEGRIKSSKFDDIKWINLRSCPIKFSDDILKWDGVMSNITQSKREKIYIENSHRELAKVSVGLEKIKEQERVRIAREIHDGLGGNLTAIKMGMASIIKKMGQRGQRDLVLDRIQQLETILDGTFEVVHKISSDLRPDALELGIVDALSWQAKEFEKQIGIKCSFTTNDDHQRLNADHEITLFRICQEELSSLAKRAVATEVGIVLTFEQDIVAMRVSDNAIVSDLVLNQESLGLRIMKERVIALNGSYELTHSNDGCSSKTIRLPIIKLDSDSRYGDNHN